MRNETSIFITCVLAALMLACSGGNSDADERPRVVVITDINHCCGDPDDIQSLCHILWYLDELDVRAIIPDNFDLSDEPGGLKATYAAIEAYQKDYETPQNNFSDLNFPEPAYLLDSVVMKDKERAIDKIYREALAPAPSPLYVLIWGNMGLFRDALFAHPEIAGKIRVLTIGTNIMFDVEGEGIRNNWNGYGRDEIWEDERFNNMWWVEMDWTYAAMFAGLEYENGFVAGGAPKEMLDDVVNYGGNLGMHMNQVTLRDDRLWANYFRAGDTPTVLYLIDPENDLDDPSLGSWAGRYIRPFPDSRPGYWTDDHGEVEWDYANPQNTWEHAGLMNSTCQATLLEVRDEMYAALIRKLQLLYQI